MASTTRRLTAVARSTARIAVLTNRTLVLLAVSTAVASVTNQQARVLHAVSTTVASIWGRQAREQIEATWRLIRPVGTWFVASADWLHRLGG